MASITTKDGTTIFYKDWGSKNSQPIVFHHGWPLSSDDWDAQMLFFSPTIIGWSRMTGAVTVAPRRWTRGTTWIITLLIPQLWQSIWI
ncbi:alpha/beta fold hydrolase [Acidicapsa acidisoli]